jgi:hypothetical protein
MEASPKKVASQILQVIYFEKSYPSGLESDQEQCRKSSQG